MQNYKTINAGKQTLYIIIGKLIALGSTLAIPLILTHTLEQNEFGIYSQFQTLTLFITSVFSFGIQTSLYYFLPNEKDDIRKIYIFQTYFILILFSFIAVMVLNVPFISSVLLGEGNISFYNTYIIIALVLMMPAFFVESLSVVNKDIKISLFYPFIQSLFKVMSIIIVFIFFEKTIDNILLAVLISLIIPFFFSFFYLLKNIQTNKKTKLINFGKLYKQLKYSIPYGSAVIINTVIRRIDKILCITYLTTTEYAIYSIAFIGIPGIQQIYDAISQVIIVKIVEAEKGGEQDKVLQLYKQLVSKTFSYTIPVIFIVMFFTKDIISILFPNNYISATPFFQLYLTTFLIGVLGTGIILRAKNKTNLTFYSYLVSAIIIVPASFFLISKFGIWGAITTAVIGGFLPKMIMFFIEMKIMSCKLADYLPWANISKILILSTLWLIPFALLKIFLSNNFFYVSISIIMYLLIVILFEIKLNIFAIETKQIKNKFNFYKEKFVKKTIKFNKSVINE